LETVIGHYIFDELVAVDSMQDATSSGGKCIPEITGETCGVAGNMNSTLTAGFSRQSAFRGK
jgi:hypothetical protein